MGSNNKGLVPPSADEEYFLAAGQYVANAPHVLISAWDGVDTLAVGVTADTMCDRMNMRPLRIDLFSLEAVMEECKLLISMPTRREGNKCGLAVRLDGIEAEAWGLTDGLNSKMLAAH